MEKKTTFIATGDSFMTRRLPQGGYEGFQELQQIIQEHDVRFNNLEITIHNKEGYPAAYSGGTWAMAEPEILDDLKKFGFNLYNTANNHSCDYSHGGLLATIQYLKQKDMLYAGTGENLAEASAPVYLETPNARVAMVAACSSFHDSDAAGNQSLTLPGRPGLNPLRFSTEYHVKPEYYTALKNVVEEMNINAEELISIQRGYKLPLPEGKLTFGSLRFQLAEENAAHTIPLEKDMERILANIREARLQADYVLVSIHAHEFVGMDTTLPAEFLETFAHECIDAGADAVMGHGPHELRGIELYKGKVIFYSLGNFIFETETVSLQPADAYENAKMPHTTMVGEYMSERSKNGTRGFVVQPEIWHSVMASFTAEEGKLKEVRLYPISLGMGLSRGQMGVPRLMGEDGNKVLEYLADLSKPYGTELQIKDGVAIIPME